LRLNPVLDGHHDQIHSDWSACFLGIDLRVFHLVVLCQESDSTYQPSSRIIYRSATSYAMAAVKILLFLALLALVSNAKALELTHYGYPGDPNTDSNSRQGIGAAGFSAPGSLNAVNASGVTATALSPDVAAQYGLVLGQQFTVVAGGQTYNLEYADKTADYLTGRIDLFDPSNTFTGSGTQVTSVQGGPVLATPQPGAGALVAATINMSIVDPLLQKFKAAGVTWATAIKGAATWLFWVLATISVAWTLITLGLRKADLMEICAELVRFIMFTGLFFWLLTNGPAFANDIVQSLWKIGGQASGNGQAVFPGDLITLGLQVFQNAVTHVNFLSPESILAPVLIAIGIMVMCTLIACNMIILLCAAYIVLYAGLIFLGFGGCRWTSDMAVNYYRSVISIGVSLMTMELLIGIGIQFLQGLVASTQQAPTSAAMAGVLCATIILAAISHRIPHMVAGMAVGGGHNGAIGSIGILSLLGAGFAGARLASVAAGAAGVAGVAGSAGLSAADKIAARISSAQDSNPYPGSMNGSGSRMESTMPSYTTPSPRQDHPPAPAPMPVAAQVPPMVVEDEPVSDEPTSPDASRGFTPPSDFNYPDEPA
jgi:type IV secretion system protein TrbL